MKCQDEAQAGIKIAGGNINNHRYADDTTLMAEGQFSFQSQRKAMTRNVQTTTQLQSSHASKVMLKILQARLQQYVNPELPDV